MCGINGVIKFNDEPVEMAGITAMNRVLAHRGPDGEGSWKSDDSKVGLGHRRLAVIDLDERASQPFHYQHLSLTYNGEIYNYKELKAELSEMGHEFSTSSDTEVILASYLAWGRKFLERLDGMFAFVIYDNHAKQGFAARDRFGEKPFYYFQSDKEFIFASEIKALGTYLNSLSINKKALTRYLVYDVVENPDNKSETFFEGIHALPPAHCIQIEGNGKVKCVQYWHLDRTVQFEGTIEGAISEFQRHFNQSVQRRLRSDVDVGTSLSGGLDSSSILAEIQEHHARDFNSFTARFEDAELDEGQFIDQLSAKYAFVRNEVWPSKEGLLSNLSTIFYHQEEPFGSSSIAAQWEVMQLAKEKGITVLLDGQGADEIIGGYEKYVRIRLGEIVRKNMFSIRNNVRKANQMPGVSIGFTELMQGLFPRFYDAIRESKIVGRNRKKRSQALGKDFKTCASDINNPFRSFTHLNDALYFDTVTYGLGKLLRFSDRNAMAHSREVRLPFLSHELVEFVFSLPSAMKITLPWTKYILRRSMEAYLPEGICWRKDKKGYAPPQKDWLKSPEIKAQIEKSIAFLLDQKIISDPNAFDEWQLIMTAELYKFSEHFNPKRADA